MKLVENWRKCYKWLSLHCMALALAFEGVPSLKETLHDNFPAYADKIILWVLIIGIFGRFVNQTKSAD